MSPSAWSRIATNLEAAGDRLGKSVGWVAGWILLLWAAAGLNYATGWRLDRFGIQPHLVRGLPGIVLAPWIHHGLAHVAANSVSLILPAWLTLVTGWRRFWIVTGITMLGSGSAVWLAGRAGTTHIGCSALVFGYAGYLILHGLLRRSVFWTGLAGAVAFLSVLPGPNGGFDVSWEGHLFGFIFGLVGAVAARRADDP